MDFPLWGGWHVTIFQPWLWVAAVLGAVCLCGYLLEIFRAAATYFGTQ